MSEHGTDKDELVDALWAEFDKHHLSSGGRNLGAWRTAWECACGFEFVSDGHRGVTLRDGMNEHLARVAVRVIPPLEVDERTPRCQFVSPSPWGPAQCVHEDGHDGTHAYSPSEAL